MRVILDVLQGPRKGRSFVFDRHDTFIVGRSRFVHCSDARGHGALARSLHDRDQSAAVRDARPGEHERDVRQQSAGGAGPARLGRRDRGRPERLPGAGRAGSDVSAARGVRRGREPGPTRVWIGADPLRRLRDAVAPQNVTIAGPVKGDATEVVEWWCALCRSEAAALPQPVPHYTTLRELGRGAMGVVYQARHNQTGQMVALKLIMPETATTRTAIDRFHREMSVISQLRHPNIVEWYEQGMTRGQFWFAMEYVAGTNLEALAKAEPGRYPDRPGLPADLPDPQGARAGPQDGLRPPRHQAREHPDRPRPRGPRSPRSPTSGWPRAFAAWGSRA